MGKFTFTKQKKKNKYETILNTVRLNGVEDRCSIYHALVGEDIHVHGPMKGASKIPPSNIPNCDVLELDCEGAEYSILQNLKIEPRVIVVEVHTPTIPRDSVTEELKNKNYEIIERTDHAGEKVDQDHVDEVWATEDGPNTFIITAIKN